MISSNGSCSSASPPLSPTDTRGSRIPIDSLLNPTGSSNPRSRSAKTSPGNDHYRDRVHPQYPQYSQQYAQRPHHSQAYQHHHYQPPQFNSVQYDPNRPLSIEVRSGPIRRTGSACSSPGPYSRGDRFPSVSSSSSAAQEQRRRPPRPKYDEEEMYFIWYHRVDLRQEWRLVRENFNAQFPDRQRSGFQGIQCKFYRFIKEKKCPTLRDQKQRENQQRGRGGSRSHSPTDEYPAYGVVNWTGNWFPWMREPRPPHYQPSNSARAC